MIISSYLFLYYIKKRVKHFCNNNLRIHKVIVYFTVCLCIIKMKKVIFLRKFIACYFLFIIVKGIIRRKIFLMQIYCLLFFWKVSKRYHIKGKRYHINLRRYFCWLLLVYYSIRDHINLRRFFACYFYYSKRWEKIFNVAYKYFLILYISILILGYKFKIS